MTLASKEYDSYYPQPNQRFSARYLGPAQVIESNGSVIRIELSGAVALARSAVTFPYEPVAGDTVLVIGQDEILYVIGVLEGSGKTTFTAPGDLEFKAPRGNIDLISSRGFRIRSPEVKVISKEIEYIAQSIVERYENAKRWVKDTFQLRAGSVRTNVESTYRMKAGKIVERAEGDVKIDGNKIHLG